MASILTQPTTLSPGAVTNVANAATGTGTGVSQYFVVPVSQTGSDRVIEYDCTGTYSVGTATVEESPDNGTTWITKVAAIDLAAAPSGYFNAIAGKILRFNFQTFTGTSVTIYVVCS